MADKSTTYNIKVKAESNAREAASSVDELRKQLATSQGTIKQYNDALRNLKGGTDAVKQAKERLKANIQAEKDKVSQSTMALLAHNASLKAVKPSTDAASNSAGEMKERLGELASGAGVAAAGVLAFTGAVVAGAGALVTWIFESSNALRTMGLFREAATGSAQNAAAFGHQIELLGSKVPQSRAELNQLSLDLSRAFNGTRVSGQAAVDTFNAVAQASAAMGDTAGRKIQEVIDRSKTFGRMGLSLFELQGTGVTFQDVAGQLAKDLHIGLAAAQQQLWMGRANVNDGAKALREVIERQFGGINARRMLDLNVLATKAKDTLVALTSDVDLSKLAGGVQDLFKEFSAATVTGKAMKSLITDFGNGVAKVFSAAGPFVKTFVQAFVVEMLRLELAVLKIANYIKEKFGVDITAALGDTSIAIVLAKNVAFGLAAALGAVVVVGGAFVAVGFAIYGAVKGIQEIFKSAHKAITENDWLKAGKDVITGLVAGLTSGKGLLDSAVNALGDNMKAIFKASLGIHSPSTVFAEYGRQTTEGYKRGVEGGSGGPQGALTKMAGPPPVSVKGVGGGGGPITINVNVEVHAEGRNAKEIASTLTGPNFKAQLTKAIEEMLIGSGLAPQTTR